MHVSRFWTRRFAYGQELGLLPMHGGDLSIDDSELAQAHSLLQYDKCECCGVSSRCLWLYKKRRMPYFLYNKIMFLYSTKKCFE